MVFPISLGKKSPSHNRKNKEVGNSKFKEINLVTATIWNSEELVIALA
jgi:hypothetical protein